MYKRLRLKSNNFVLLFQAKDKKTSKPTIIRLTTPQGNMNPKFHEVDLVPDADLNTKLKFHVSVVRTENTHRWLKNQCTAGHQFYKTGSDQKRKNVVICM